MRESSPELAMALAESHQVRTFLAVYYDGEPVFDVLPITDGTLEIDGTNAIPGGLSVTVPRYITDDAGRTLDIAPFTPGPSIDAEGTQLAVNYEVSIPGAGTESIGMGWFRIAEWEESEGALDVTAESLESLIAEARFINPMNIGARATYRATAERIVGDLLPLEITADDARVTEAETFEDDRLEALRGMVTEWPAYMTVDDAGTLVISPPLDDAADPIVFHLTDGEAGTVVKRPRSGSRDGIYNAVKATGEESSGNTEPVFAVAYLRDGPRRWNGPYGNVPLFYTSPYIKTKAAARRAANTRLKNVQVTAQPVNIETAPDPRLQIGDVGTITYDGTTQPIRINALSIPLTPDGGPMTIRGSVVNREEA